jgi:uncharacterized membrane protein YfcA
MVGGLLGIGGGVVLMPLLRFGVGLSPARAAGTCILAVFFTTLGGSYRHYRLGHLNLRSLLPVIGAGIVATIVFSVLFRYLAVRERWLDLGVGIVFSLISIRMIYEGIPRSSKGANRETRGSEIPGSVPEKVIVGSAAGLLPGLLGIGTGVILVPAFAYVMDAPIKVAMGSSLACFSFNAFISSLFKLGQGFIDLRAALPICIGALMGANIGAVVNRRFPPRGLKLVFGVLFSFVSLRFFLSCLGV